MPMLTIKEWQECQRALQHYKIKRFSKLRKTGEKVFTTSVTSECSTTITSF